MYCIQYFTDNGLEIDPAMFEQPTEKIILASLIEVDDFR